MSSTRPPQIHVTALRACGHHARVGMRYGAHLKTMLALKEIGYVEERLLPGHREAKWFLTPAGRELLDALGPGDAGD